MAHELVNVRRLHVLADVRARVGQAAVVLRVGERALESESRYEARLAATQSLIQASTLATGN